MQGTYFLSLVYLIGVILSSNIFATELKTLLTVQEKTHKQGIKSQKYINTLAEQSSDMLQEYQSVLEQLQTLRIYNQQLEKLLLSQKQQIRVRTAQINSIEQTEQRIVPLMLQMIDTLEQFIQLDIPFLVTERLQKVQQLKALMNQAGVNNAEKYRQIVQLFLQEMEYGNTIEAWQGVHPDDPKQVVEFLRIGRIALLYQSLDKKEAFYWSIPKADFQVLPVDYQASLERGLKIAKKQLAPEFIKIPVGQLEVLDE